MAKKIIILGGEGLLGKELKEYFTRAKDFSVIAFGRELDITKLSGLTRVFKKEKPDVVINAAAAVNVDECEGEPEKAWAVNAVGAGNVASALSKSGSENPVLVHISTSDVFGHSKSKGKFWLEDDKPIPINAYGRSKLGGEWEVQRETKAP